MGKIFKRPNTVRMHDTDAAGILYFARQFRFVHDTIEDFMEEHGYSFQDIFTNNEEDFRFVIVHCESSYKATLLVGDKLNVHLRVGHMSETSFSFVFDIYKTDQTLVGTAKTVHVTISAKTGQKMPIPQLAREALSEYIISTTKEHSNETL